MSADTSSEPTVWLWTHDLTEQREPVADWLETLDEEERAQCRRFRRAADRVAYAAAHALLYRALGATLGVARDALRLARDAMGRPYLATPAALALDFNLSHTEGLVAVALSTAGRVGVDVEDGNRPLPPGDELHAYGVSDEELAQIKALATAPAGRHFMTLWSSREAVAKADGRGLSLPFCAIAIDLARNVARIAPPADARHRDWRLWRESPTPRHLLTLACERHDARLEHPASLLSLRSIPRC